MSNLIEKETGEISPVKVQLSKNSGEIAVIKGRPHITFLGYRKLNLVAGISFIIPPRCCIVGNEIRLNPNIKLNKVGLIERITLRKIGIGSFTTGNVVFADKIVSFSPYTFFLLDLLKVVKSCPDCGYFGTPENKLKKVINQDTKIDLNKEKSFCFVLLHCIAEFSYIDTLGLWIDLHHPKIQEVILTYSQRQKFADKIADRYAEYECLKALIPINQMKFDPKTGIAEVEVFKGKPIYEKLYLKIKQALNLTGRMEIINPTEENIQIIESELYNEEKSLSF